MEAKNLVLSFLTAALGSVLITKTAESEVGAYNTDGYKSPYEVQFRYPMEELMAIDNSPPRNDRKLESSMPFEEWYSRRTRKEWGVWGPPPRHYPAHPDYDRMPVAAKRERVLAVACSFIGLPYQHHHIPDWDPPRDWPWKPVAYGRNSKGVDCSDFSSWCYNYGLGIKMSTGVKRQANVTEIEGPGPDRTTHAKQIVDDNGYENLCKKLKTADLLYIRNRSGELAHVIMWVGEIGKSPDGAPLIIDCTGEGHKDANGVDIPIGVHLRPFLKNEWYYKSFDHAHRLLHDEQ